MMSAVSLRLPLPNRIRSHSRTLHRLAVLLCIVATQSVAAQTGPNARKQVWQVASHDCQLQIISHLRPAPEGEEPHSDRFRMVTGRGERADFACSIQPLSVIDELELSVPFLSSQPGQQVMARVVLPRTINPKNGRPITFSVHGDIYSKPGSWQLLRLPNIARQIDQHVRILRSEHGPTVDGREAFVDHLVVNGYAGVGSYTIRLGDPVIRGAVEHGTTLLPQTIAKDDSKSFIATPVSATLPLQAPRRKKSFRLEGDLLLVGERPFFVRGVQAQGEDWAYLKKLGFNTLQLSTPVTGAQVQRAEALNLWLVAPPPRNWTRGDLGQPYRRVLAWNLGHGLTSADLPSTRARADQVRAADTQRRRPILCSPDTDLAAFDEFADILLHHREPIGSSFPVNQYRGWLTTRASLSLAGTVHWSVIQTEPLPEILNQAAAFGFGARSHTANGDPTDDALSISAEQMESLAFDAVATGTRGILFASRSRLDADSPNARRRSVAMRSLNLKLDAIAPWVAGGRVAARDLGDDPASPTTVLRTARSWLVLPASQTSGSELTIPGIPIALEVFEFGPTGLRRLEYERTTGGMRLRIDDSRRMVLMTRDPLVIGHVHDKLVAQAPIAAELQRQLADAHYQRTHRTLNRLGRSTELLEPAFPLIAACDAQIHSGQYTRVHRISSEARAIIVAERERLRRSPEVAALTSSRVPWSHHLDAAAWQVALPSEEELAKLTEHLPTGDVEDLATMREAGWRNWEHAPVGITTSVRLASDSPSQGERCLQLTTETGAADDNTANQVAAYAHLEKPLLWITTPKMRFPPGTQVLIRGSIRMQTAPAYSHDGAMLFDSIGGPNLAFRVEPAEGWQHFSMIRAIDELGELNLTLTMMGIGQVELDGLSVVSLRSP